MRYQTSGGIVLVLANGPLGQWPHGASWTVHLKLMSLPDSAVLRCTLML
jgi:hypothetical protein